MAKFDFGPPARGDELATTITIRELFAVLALTNINTDSPKNSAEWAVTLADMLLIELAEDSGGGL